MFCRLYMRRRFNSHNPPILSKGERLRAKQANRNSKAAAKKEIALEAQGHVDIDGESDEDDDEDSDDGSIPEDLGIETIIDDVNPYSYFKESLTRKFPSFPRHKPVDLNFLWQSYK